MDIIIEREILFRGKIINCDLVVSKEWIYGSYCDEAKSPIRLKGEKDYTLCPHISKYDQHYSLKGFGNLGAPRFYEVHPSTVGQYIGLTDKNGVKIFEGDIVKQKTTTEFAKVNPFEWEKYGIVRFGVYDWRPSHAGYRSVGWYVEPLKKVPINPTNYDIGNINAGLNQVDILNEYYPYEVIGNIHDNPEILKNPNP